MALLPKHSLAHQTWLYLFSVPSWRMSYTQPVSSPHSCVFFSHSYYLVLVLSIHLYTTFHRGFCVHCFFSPFWEVFMTENSFPSSFSCLFKQRLNFTPQKNLYLQYFINYSAFDEVLKCSSLRPVSWRSWNVFTKSMWPQKSTSSATQVRMQDIFSVKPKHLKCVKYYDIHVTTLLCFQCTEENIFFLKAR